MFSIVTCWLFWYTGDHILTIFVFLYQSFLMKIIKKKKASKELAVPLVFPSPSSSLQEVMSSVSWLVDKECALLNKLA